MTVNRTQAPPIHDAVTFDLTLPKANLQTCPNGTELIWYAGGSQDVAEVTWIFPAGVWFEKQEGVAIAMGALLRNGTTTKTAAHLNTAIEFYGASLRCVVTNDDAHVILHCLSKHLIHLLPLVKEILTESEFEQTELDIYIKNNLQNLQVNLLKPDFVASQYIDKQIFGEQHPYGRHTKKEVLENLKREEILTFYKERIVEKQPKIFVAGRIDDSHLKSIENFFGTNARSPEQEDQPLAYEIKSSTERKLTLINDPKGVQTALRIGKIFPNRQHPDFAALVVLNTLFGGYFGSRLMTNIREDKGYTYGIYSSIMPARQGGALVIQSEVGKNVADPAIKEIYKELEILNDKKVCEAELQLVKNYLLGNLLGDLDGPFNIIQRWKSLLLNGHTIENFDRNISIFKNVTPEELLKLTHLYFHPESFYEVVVT